MALDRLITPLTFEDRMLGCRSHSHGTPGAAAVTILSISPHARSRSAGSTVSSALSIAASIRASSSWAKFELLVSRMFAPLNVGPSRVSASGKSFSQPTLGQTSGWLSGTWQNFVYMVSRVT